MKKYGKYIILTLAGILAYNLLKAKSMTSTAAMFANFRPEESIKLVALADSLQRAGFTGEKLRWALASVLHETGRFSRGSNVARLNNNYSGIKWLNKPRQVATKGSPVPAGERIQPASNPLNFYARFATIDDWAKDYYRIVSSFGSKPITATTPEEWVNKLKQNSYFGGPQSVYLTGVRRFLAMFS